MERAHENVVEAQFGPRAKAYVDSAVHAQGAELEALEAIIREDWPGARPRSWGRGRPRLLSDGAPRRFRDRRGSVAGDASGGGGDGT